MTILIILTKLLALMRNIDNLLHKRSFEDDTYSTDDGNDEEYISNDNLFDDAESTNDEKDEEYIGNINFIDYYMN